MMCISNGKPEQNQATKCTKEGINLTINYGDQHNTIITKSKGLIPHSCANNFEQHFYPAIVMFNILEVFLFVCLFFFFCLFFAKFI